MTLMQNGIIKSYNFELEESTFYFSAGGGGGGVFFK